MSTENIDWSKAPEGTTHIRLDDTRNPWRLKDDIGSWYAWAKESWTLVIPDSSAVYTPRPGVSAEGWSGNGLPPVGTACEWLDPGSDRWLPVEIVFLSSWVIVVRDTNPHPDGPVDLAFDLINMNPQFRAVRTAEQIAAEAREASIKQMMKDVCCVAARDIFEDLYDAGYRKVVPAGAQP